MTGAGNDFVLIDNRLHQFDRRWSEIAPKLCDRRYGIGGDGVIVISSSTRSDFEMLYFNADGSQGAMCGNGGRCAAAFVMELSGKKSVEFEAIQSRYIASASGANLKLTMTDPASIRLNIHLSVGDIPLRVHTIDTGSPHVILFKEDIPVNLLEMASQENFGTLGPLIRNHETFRPDGTNVNFVDFINGSTLAMRTYERGVEGETLACGTGAVASAIIAHMILGLPSPVNIQTRSGETLIITFKSDGQNISSIFLEGPANKVFTGFISLNVPE